MSCYRTYKVHRTNANLTEIRTVTKEENTEAEPVDWSHGLLAQNPDYAGWLTVYGTAIDDPVVLGKTNDTYLRRDFYGEYSIAGTLFFDETTDFSRFGNRIIYGHMMRDDTMFGSLDNFKSMDFFQENGYVTLEDVNGTHAYKIFAVMVLPGSAADPSFIDPQQWSNVLDDEATAEMLATIEARASIYQEPFLTDETDFLFLITCDWTKTDGRLCLVAKRITEGDEEGAVPETWRNDQNSPAPD